MNLNTDSKLGVQSMALIGATVVTALDAAKNITKVFVGTDNISARTNSWSQASKQEGYFSSIGKRIQFFTGSDSLSQRISSLFRGLVMGAASIVMSDLARTNSQSSTTTTELRAELADIGFEASNAKNVAGEYIEACLKENQSEKVKDLLACITKAFSTMNETLTSSSGDLKECQGRNLALNFDFAKNQESYADLKLSNTQLKTDQSACNTARNSKDTEIRNLESERNSKDTEIRNLQSEILALTLSVNKAVQENSNFTMTFDTLTDNLTALRGKVDRLDPENTVLKQDLQKLQGEVATKQQKLDAAGRHKNELHQSIQVKQSKINAITVQRDQALQAQKAAEAKLKQSQEDLAEAKK